MRLRVTYWVGCSTHGVSGRDPVGFELDRTCRDLNDCELHTEPDHFIADPNFVAVGLIQHRLLDFCRCGHGEFVAVCLLPRNDGIAQNADLLDLAFDDVSGLQIPRFRIRAERRNPGHGAG
jgi:hypothetical protein